MTDKADEYWMRKALALARRAMGLCSPNPMVGAVVVKDGKCIGAGYHHKAGEAHAEPNALDSVGGDCRGATLYVTLEPCSTYGRTPPCTRRIIEAGIARVVIGCLDDNPRHQGAAVRILREARITVESGVLENACRKLNEAFFWWIRTGKPFVMLKMAMTLDGKIATASGSSQWITGAPARNYVQKLRSQADAVMVGGSTVLADNPSLTVRVPANWPRQPRRLVWTSRALPPDTRMLHDGGPQPELAKPATAQEWHEYLLKLGSENVTFLLLEGGGELAASALRAGAVSKVAFFIAPKLLCGRGSRPVSGGENPASLDEALLLKDMESRKIGDDLLVTGYCTDVHGID